MYINIKDTGDIKKQISVCVSVYFVKINKRTLTKTLKKNFKNGFS